MKLTCEVFCYSQRVPDSESSFSNCSDSSDESYIDEAPISSEDFKSTDMNDGSNMDVDTEDLVVQPDEDGLAELTTRNAQEWCKRWLGTPESQKTAIQ